MEFLSVMSKGSTQEKILWSFEFLDIDKNGYISKQEMVKVGRKTKFDLSMSESRIFLDFQKRTFQSLSKRMTPSSSPLV